VAGYRDFQTGEVLTAANVNDFLMEQAVMTFADDAARTTALTDVLREGLLTYNLDTNRLEVYDGSGWVEPAPEPPAGIGSNVVQAALTSRFTLSSSSYTSVTGMAATITPSTATSKVLLIAQFSMSPSSPDSHGSARIVGGNASTYVGDTSGSRITGATAFRSNSTNFALSRTVLSSSIVYLDAPASASPVTYQLEMRVNTGLLAINGVGDDDNLAERVRTASSITAIEVAA
jgi:hypothetical protein